MNDDDSAARFTIFRREDSPSLAEAGLMSFEPFKDSILPILDQVQEAGVFAGEDARVLFAIPGFSLVHVWFKPGYPLPLHSHDADCLYYIIAGSIRMGSQDLGPRTGFFVPANVPYAYTPGPDGVELLEFRHSVSFNFMNHANGLAFWQKALETVKAAQPTWDKAQMPALQPEG
ncbi:cupin domain-containing protein [Novosphingobium sp. M1R2S20]|uniref:Cupin domain-containing protein n=1 Tax=Novosphingobium rhizovicinum TaxID=3228928 RepID=A0ABV3R6Z7_9SPHN